MRVNRSCMEHLPCMCAHEAVYAAHLKLLWVCECMYVCLFPLVYICAWTCVCAWILQLGESVHVHYIRRSVRGAPQHVCTAVCSELSAPAGCAIPIYPSATEVGGKSAEHRCLRFHIRGTRLPVRRPLCGSDEGGRLQGHSVWELGLLGDGGVVRGGRAARLDATLESVDSLFSGELSCQAAHLFDTRRCGMAVRGCLSWFTSPYSLVCSKNLDNSWSPVSLEVLAKLCCIFFRKRITKKQRAQHSYFEQIVCPYILFSFIVTRCKGKICVS